MNFTFLFQDQIAFWVHNGDSIESIIERMVPTLAKSHLSSHFYLRVFQWQDRQHVYTHTLLWVCTKKHLDNQDTF